MSAEASTKSAVSGFEIPTPPPRELAIQVRDLHKSYPIPTQRVDTLKERVAELIRRREHRVLRALDGISFEIGRGEFFGIVGRNGSGKSTLLKLLASIYRADSGTIRVAGRLAPFIELGVGFNHELPAEDNIVLNGVMMGLTPRDARGRVDEIIAFAELDDFRQLKLKNYSSGMLVRLSFAMLTQVDADILLVDEVLAVGDASFQQKCFDAFARLHDEGRTIVLVTHDMHAVEAHCDRALLLENGKIERHGNPAEVTRRYLELQFEDYKGPAAADRAVQPGLDPVRFLDTWVEGGSGQRTTSLAHGETFRIRARVEVERAFEHPLFSFQIDNGDGLAIFAPEPFELDAGGLGPGDRVAVTATVANPLAPGHYTVHCAVGERVPDPQMTAFRRHAADFIVYGIERFTGVVALECEAEAHVERDGGGSR